MVYEAACITAPTINTALASASVLSLPYHSDKLPVDMAPTKQPISYMDTTAPVTPEQTVSAFS